jgi:putative transposase
MPAKNTIRNFDADAMYHVYNRGNNKRQIFFDKRDYEVFLSFLKYALLSEEAEKADDVVNRRFISDAKQFNLRRLKLSGKLELVAFCLMPNHFHLLLYQYDKTAITKLMQSVSTGYVMYFNHRYGTTGGLFQSRYRSVQVGYESYWQHISRYIHLNPLDLGVDFNAYDYSSYKYYSGNSESDWLRPNKGLCGMDAKSYEKFLENWLPHREKIKEIAKFLADK